MTSMYIILVRTYQILTNYNKWQVCFFGVKRLTKLNGKKYIYKNHFFANILL